MRHPRQSSNQQINLSDAQLRQIATMVVQQMQGGQGGGTRVPPGTRSPVGAQMTSRGFLQGAAGIYNQYQAAMDARLAGRSSLPQEMAMTRDVINKVERLVNSQAGKVAAKLFDKIGGKLGIGALGTRMGTSLSNALSAGGPIITAVQKGFEVADWSLQQARMGYQAKRGILDRSWGVYGRGSVGGRGARASALNTARATQSLSEGFQDQAASLISGIFTGDFNSHPIENQRAEKIFLQRSKEFESIYSHPDAFGIGPSDRAAAMQEYAKRKGLNVASLTADEEHEAMTETIDSKMQQLVPDSYLKSVARLRGIDPNDQRRMALLKEELQAQQVDARQEAHQNAMAEIVRQRNQQIDASSSVFFDKDAKELLARSGIDFNAKPSDKPADRRQQLDEVIRARQADWQAQYSRHKVVEYD